MFFRLISRLRGYFISGFFTLIPIGLSVLVVWWFVHLVDGTLAPVLEAFFGRHLPGLGFVSAAAVILLVGFLTSHVFGEQLLSSTEEVLQRIPVFKWVYGTVKQMVDAFSPDNKASFKGVVVVEYPRRGTFSMGFVTNEVTLFESDGTGRELVTVYIPTNHVYFGEVAMFPKDEVFPTSLSVQQGIQCSLSAGAAIPSRLERKTAP